MKGGKMRAKALLATAPTRVSKSPRSGILSARVAIGERERERDLSWLAYDGQLRMHKCIYSNDYFSELVHFSGKKLNEYNEGYNHFVLVKFYGNSFFTQNWPKPWIIAFAP